MCVIVSVYKLPDFDRKTRDEIMSKIYVQAHYNQDGVGIIGAKYDMPRIQTIRRLSLETINLREVFEKNDVINIHLRQATHGNVSAHNIHFWRADNWFFAHNGVVGRFAYGQNKDLVISDSQLFFREVIKKGYLKDTKLKVKKIKKLASDLSFWGRAVFFNKLTKQTMYFGDFYVYVIKGRAIVVSTAPIDFKIYHNVWGLRFIEDKPVFEREVDGVFCIDAQKQRYEYFMPFVKIGEGGTRYSDNEYSYEFKGKKYKQDYETGDWQEEMEFDNPLVPKNKC